MIRPTEHRERIEPVGPWKVRLTSYRLGEEFVCVADNVDPGANLARIQAPTREEAETRALAKARERLERGRGPGSG